MRTSVLLAVVLALGTILAAVSVGADAAGGGASVEKVDAAYVETRLGKPEVIVIDVRWPDQWAESRFKIPGAVWRHSFETEKWAKDLPPAREIIVYCA